MHDRPFSVPAFLCLAASCAACLGLAPSTRSAPTPLVLHVAPEGKDAWSGRPATPDPAGADGPLASLTGARDALRRLRADGEGRGSVRIEVADGTYPLTEPLVLEPQDGGRQDAPVVYAAAPGARPVFSGGRRLTGWRVRPDGLWERQLPEVAAGRWYFEQLWVDGRRATRARSPNRFYHHLLNVQEVTLEPGPRRPRQARLTLEVAPEVMALLEPLGPQGLRDIHFLAFHKWDNTRRRIERIDLSTRSLVTTGEGMKPWNPLLRGTRFILENLRTALDEPGEWFLGHDGTLLYKPLPGQRPDTTEVIAPVVERFIVIRGRPEEGRFVEHIQIRGLRFEHGQYVTPPTGFEPSQAASPIEAAVQVDGARQVAIVDSAFRHLGLYGVWFRRACQDCRLERCLLEDVGAGGVRIGEPSLPPPAARTYGVHLLDNIIRGGGRLFPCAVGVWIGQSGSNQVSHNDIGDFFYTGISAGWRWGYGESLAKTNRITFNHVHHLGQGVLSDLGGIYTLGPSEGTVVANNRFHDIWSWSYGGWGLYTDEGSSGILFENNLVHHTKTGGFHQHYGRENIVRNNILAFAKEQQLQVSRVEDHLSFTFENNIVLWDEGELARGPWDQVRVRMRRNLYWPMRGGPVRFGQQSFAAWQAAGHDEGSVIADPMFVDARANDYRLQPQSPALGLGFKPFDPQEAGVRGPASWRALAQDYPWPERQLPPPPPALSIRDDFEATTPGRPPDAAEVHLENRGDLIAVTDSTAASGRHSLEVRDAPGLERTFNPHLVYRPHHRTGLTQMEFDIRLSPGAWLVVEWRDYQGGGYQTGPMVIFRNGRLELPGQSPRLLPAERWLHCRIRSGLGNRAAEGWSFQLEGESVHIQHDNLPQARKAFRELDWVGFISNARDTRSVFLDNLEIIPRSE